MYIYGECGGAGTSQTRSAAALRRGAAGSDRRSAPPPLLRPDSSAAARPFAYKLNRRRTTEAAAYDAVTLWNVRKVKAKNRRMRLSDTTRREKVRLLKFFTERNRKKGVRPHLLGNVAGYTWADGVYDEPGHKWRSTPKHIAAYTLRDEYDSVRRARRRGLHVQGSQGTLADVAADAVYLLDGERVPGSIFQFIDGLILRTLEIYTDTATMARCGAGRGVVIGDIYPDRVPLVVFNGAFSSIESWLKMCRPMPSRCRPTCRCTISTCFPSKPCRPMACGGNTVRSASTSWSDFGPKDCRRRRAAAPCTKTRTKCAVPCRARSATTAERACREVLIRIAAPLV